MMRGGTAAMTLTEQEQFEAIESLMQRHQMMCRNLADWKSVWQMFLDSEVFIEICDQAARSTLRQCGLPLDCLDDLRQESMIYFAQIVKKHPSLNFRSEKGTYRQWLATLLRGCARKAVRQFKDRIRQRVPVIDNMLMDDSSVTNERRLDLIVGVNQLDCSIRAVVLLHCKGQTISQIAKSIGRGERTIYRMLKRGTTQLETILRASD